VVDVDQEAAGGDAGHQGQLWVHAAPTAHAAKVVTR
jgi:hypothetical protein